MSTTITAENGIEFEVCELGLSVIYHGDQTETWARLSDAQRVELAAALDPGRRGLHVRLDNQAATLATYRRECDEALRKKGEAFDRAVRAERERDAAVARAEQLIPAYAMLDIWMALGWDSIHFDDWYDEHGYADAWAELTAAVREARTAPVVSRADIEKAIRGKPILRRWLDDSECVGVSEAVDAMCDLFGVEAEPADPVEQKAAELFGAAFPGEAFDQHPHVIQEPWINAARHVLGQEASSDE